MLFHQPDVVTRGLSGNVACERRMLAMTTPNEQAWILDQHRLKERL